MEETGHEAVMVEEVLEWLRPGEGRVFVDCTMGRGGHSRAIAERLGGGGVLIGVDVDPRNLGFAKKRLEGVECEVRLFVGNFSELGEVLKEAGKSEVDGILADLGVSTNQLFDEAYGLSFERGMKLDMRLDPELPKSAADLVNEMPEEELANVLYELAQERYSRRIARKIGEARRISPIKTTEELAGLVRSAVPHLAGKGGRKRSGGIDPATRTFLALRMAVNGEMRNLERLLEQGPAALKSGGRMAVISFQSMEDGRVKRAFGMWQEKGVTNVLTKKPLVPGEEEIRRNPRSRSAKMRVMEKR